MLLNHMKACILEKKPSEVLKVRKTELHLQRALQKQDLKTLR